MNDTEKPVSSVNPERAELIASLRALADLLESTPDLPAPRTTGGLGFFLPDDRVREQVAAIEAAPLTSREVKVDGNKERYGFHLSGRLRGLELHVYAKPALVCTPTGTKTVTTYDYHAFGAVPA